MFALIITVVSIGLVIVLATVTASYLGDVMKSAGPKQSASLIIAQATQVAGASRVFAATRTEANFTVQDLVTANFLKSIPKPPFSDGAAYTLTTDHAARLAISNEVVCAEIQRKLTGNPVIPVLKPAQGCYNSDGAFVFVLNG